MRLQKITGVAALIIFLLFASNTVSNAVPPRATLKPSDYSTGITYKQALKRHQLIAVNFYVDWCHYCQHFAPVLESMRQKYQSKYTFVIVKADNPANKVLVNDFSINSYPSLYLVNPKNDNRVFINQSLYDNPKKLSREFDRFIKTNK